MGKPIGLSLIARDVLAWFKDEVRKDDRVILTDIPRHRMIGGTMMAGKVSYSPSGPIRRVAQDVARAYARNLYDNVLKEMEREGCSAMELSRVEVHESNFGGIESVHLGFKVRLMNVSMDDDDFKEAWSGS